MEVVCLDLEGVLVPEIWVKVAERTGIEALRSTTRDVPDYDQLMRQRIGLLDAHGLTIHEIRSVIEGLEPLPGAGAFLDSLRSRYQVVILSDTFYQFATPLMRKLAWPTLLCNRLEVDADGKVLDYRLRQPDQKRHAVRALRGLSFRVFAAGDSYNDIGMLEEADAGIFFRPPEVVVRDYPDYPVTVEYDELEAAISDRAQARPSPG